MSDAFHICHRHAKVTGLRTPGNCPFPQSVAVTLITDQGEVIEFTLWPNEPGVGLGDKVRISFEREVS